MSDTAIEALRYSEFPNSSDCISRQAAIDALKKISFSHWFECGEYLSEDTREIEIINSSKALETIEALPSAQPEKRTKKRMETHACDLIDREAAVDALHMHLMYRMGTDSNKKRLDDWINGVPSAQPEPKWIPCRESNGNIHPYSELLHERKDILVTYKTRTGRRYVKQVLCNHGRVEKILLGDIVAWLPLPTPYREDKMQTE